MKPLRPYQSAALKALWDWIYNESGFPVISAPVNAGKSLMIADFIKQCHTKWPFMKTIMLIHDQKLLRQNMEELREQWPEVDAGFYSASIGQKRLHNDVVVAGIQSIHAKASLLNKAPNLIVIDECHTTSNKKDTQYRRFIDDCLKLNPKLKVIGFTGTAYRTDSGHLCSGKDALFSGIAYEIPIKFMIDEGYSIRPVIPQTQTVMDTSAVKMRGGDFVERELQQAIDIDEITKACVSEIIEVGQRENRKQWIVYTAGIEHCEHVYEEFKRRGISCERAHSRIDDQDDIVKRYKAGQFQCLVNVSQYTTGFSHNGIDLMAFMRPTRSPVLYMQMIGRGMRTNYAPNMPLDTKEQRLAAIAASVKPNFTLLDFGGVVAELGPIDALQIKEKRSRSNDSEEKEPVEPKIKYCPQCEAPASPAQRHCYECGYEFASAAPLIDTRADTQSAVLSEDIKPEKLAVLSMTLSKHVRKHRANEPEDKEILPVLKVTYQTYAGNIYEWVCFNHTGLARKKALEWHRRHMPEEEPIHGQDVDFALMLHEQNKRPYWTPDFIWAKKNGKYWEFVRAEFGEREPIRVEDESKFTGISQRELEDYVGF